MVVPAIEPAEVSDLRSLLVVVPPPTRHGSGPAVGWTRLALAMHDLAGQPGIFAVEFSDRTPLSIDWSRGYYWWETDAAAFLGQPPITRLRVAKGVRLPHVLEDPQDLEGLVWLVGLRAFDGGTPWWADGDERYSLDRWPDLGSLPHTPAQMHMTALLGTGDFDVTELAETAGVEVEEARRLVTALDLMGLLAVRPGTGSRRRRRAGGGLLGRLRSRLGG